MDNNWLAELKVGDKVILDGQNTKQICIVERFTKTQIVLKDTFTKYNRRTAYSIGTDAWNISVLRQATDEAVQAIRNQDKRRPLLVRIRNTDWYSLPTDLLQRILNQIGETNVLPR